MRFHQFVRRDETPASALLDGTVANHDFEAAWHAAHIARAIDIERDVPQVTRAAQRALEQAAVHHRGSAHTRAEREQEDVAKTTRRTQPGFSEQRGVRVVQDW